MRFRRTFRFPWRSRRQIARDLDAELAFHLEMRVRDLVAAGVPPREAERRAREEFGDLDFTRAYCLTMDERTDRAARLTDRFDGWRQDLHYAARTLRRSPGFAAIALLTLALTIGANTAVFSATRAVLLAPLPYGDPARVVALFEHDVANPARPFPLSAPNYLDLRAEQRAFGGLAAFDDAQFTWLPASGDPEFLQGAEVEPTAFDVLRVRPIVGRGFAPGDETAGRDRKVVLSYGLWRRGFAGDPAVVGRTMTLGGTPYEIVGVMPRGFTLGEDEVLWVPFDARAAAANPATTRKQHYLQVVARLRDGVSLDAARADAAAILRRLAAQYPDANTGHGATVTPMHDVVSGPLRPALWLLQGAAAMVLLIGCANLTNLTLSRAVGRRRETALRAALGSGRGRLVRQMLAESLLLAVGGGALGVAIAVVGTRALLALNPEALPSMFTAAVDGRVLAFSVLVSLGTGLLFGLAPALHASREAPGATLKEGARGASGGRGRERARRGLVAAQMALAVTLLVGAGLLVRSFDALLRVRLGFEPAHVLTGVVRAGGERYDSAAAVNRFFDALLDDVAHTPGVVAAGAVSILPTQGSVYSGVRVVGEPVDEARVPDIRYLAVRGDYFAALRIPLLAGRAFEARDAGGGPEPVLINDAARRRFFPRGDALGRQIRIGPDPKATPLTIVGVVGDVRADGPAQDATPTLFAFHAREPWLHTMSLVVRTTDEPATVAGALRRAVRRADRTLAIRDVRSLDAVLGASLSPRRFALGLTSAFAAIAMLLAAVGIYGVLSYAVANRTRELGVRLALGATTRGVLLLVVRQGVAWSLAGLALGVGAALAGGRLLEGMLFGVRATDPLTFAAVALGLLVVVVLACAVPARRATRVDPIASVRAD
jgi:predicted permease